MTNSEILNATVIERRDLTPELAIVRIRPDSGTVTSFIPGQFCTIGLPKEEPPPSGAPTPGEEAAPGKRARILRRAYSIASSADVRDHYELYLVLVDQGRLTTRLWTIPQGGRLWLDSRVDGHFTLEGVEPDKDLVMVATGTGIAPYLSMLRTYRDRNVKRWRRFVVIHGTRLAADLGYQEEIERISYDDPSVFYIPIVTREPMESEWKGMRGRVHAALEPAVYERLIGAKLDPQHAHVFLCGNPAMIEEAAAFLVDRGFVTKTKTAPGNLHYERYW